MNVVLWVIAGVLAAAMLGAGLTKLSQPTEKLVAKMGWVEDFSPAHVKAIGGLEVLAAIGLIVPPALDIVPILAPVAALGLVLLMGGAVLTHLRRKEATLAVPSAVFLVLAAVVVWGRFGPYAF